MENERPGQALAATLETPGFYAGDPFPHYARLRREAPLAWNAQLGYWAVSKHADVVSISRDPDAFCSGKGILTFEIGVEYPSPPTMMHTDPPDHTRYRKLVQPGFSPSRMRALSTRVRARADELAASVIPGESFDAVEALAVPFPLWIIAELLGIPESDWPRFYQWSEASIPGATDWPPEECARLQAEMHEYLLETTRSRRGDPRDDIISVLAHAEVDGESLTDDELVMFLNQLLVAGNETTRHAISGGIATLAERPDQWKRLGADRSLLEPATEEVLRWTTPVISFMRTATRDTDIRGVSVAAGDPLLLLYASANRDEEEFGTNAEEFDIARDPNHEVALGFGPHFCLGAALARIEISAMLSALLDRFDEIEPAGDVERTASFVIAGIFARARDPAVTTIAPRGSAYRGNAVQLDLPVIDAGATATVAVPDGIEAALVLLAGEIEVDGHRLHRRDVFAEAASAVYLPPGSSLEVSASTRTELALAATIGGELRTEPGATAVVVEPGGVDVHDRGRPGWHRQVHDVIADSVPARRLLVGETFNAAGEWSSFPPHKHDGGDGEPALEEVYYYRFDRPAGFGFQGLYETAGPDRDASERAVFLRHGAVVGIPNGYHPVCAAPGYRLYYLWALSPLPGTPRALALHEDPAHRWLHDRPLTTE